MKYHSRKAIVLTLLLPGLVCLALAGCSRTPPTAAEVRVRWTDKVNQTIADPARAQQVVGMISRLLDDHEAKVAALQSASDRLAALNADHHATEEQAMAIYAEYETSQRELLTKFKDDVLALRRQLSAAEWQGLVD